MKHLLSIFLVVTVLFSVTPTYAKATVSEIKDKTNILTVDNNTTADDITGSEVVVVAYEDIELIAKDAKSIVDSGKILYITAPQTSAEDIAVQLSIPKEGVTSYRNELLTAYSIFNIDDLYVFQNHYVTIGEVVDKDSVNSLSNNVNIEEMQEKQLPTTDESNFELVKTINNNDIAKRSINKFITNGIDAAVQARQSINEDEIVHVANDDSMIVPFSTTLPSGTSRIYNDSLDVYDDQNVRLGYVNVTVRVYDVGRVKVNNVNQFVYNVVAKVEAFPTSLGYVRQYQARLHCNITGHTMLESINLPSGVNTSESLSLTGTLTSAEGGGSVTYDTTWTYNPESQTIDRYSNTPKVIDWVANTVSPKKGKSYDLAPGITVASTGQTGQRGAFAKVTVPALDANGYVMKINTFEVGGWF